MIKPAAGSQLAQARPSGTTAVNAFTATMRTEITAIIIANTTGSAANASLYHDNDGSTFDATTALMEAKSVGANDLNNDFVFHPGGGLFMEADGQIGVKTGTGSSLTFTIYGITEAVK